jgi:hypothetical protein
VSKAAARRLLGSLKAEAARRSAKDWNPRSLLYPDQLKVFDDQTPDRVVIGTRQFGKSLLAAVLLADAGVQQAGVNVVYLDFDIEHASKVVVEDWQMLIDKANLPARVVDGELHFTNGSKGYVFSGRANEIVKLQGLKPALIVIDEAQDAPDLEGIIKLVRPGLMRFGGRIVAMGIPGYISGVGPWWDITEGTKATGWGQHRGHMDRNPFLPAESRERQRAKAIEDLGGIDSADYQRHWLGIWPTLDNSLRVFRYFPDLNGYAGDPPPCKWYGLGLDPGGVLDAEALVMVGHGNGDGAAWVVDEDETAKGEGGSYDDTADRVTPLVTRWNPLDAFYDYGSARKDGMKLILDADKRISFKAVPSKDPEQEILRINRMLAARKLWIRKGSKLEQVMKVSMWDARARAAGKSVFAKSKALKQNLADALRASLWAVEAFSKSPEPEPDPRQANQLRIRREIDAALDRESAADYESLVGEANR